MAQYTARQRRWPEPHSNLFNTVKEMTLRSKKCWISPQTANRNNGAVLIVTLQSNTQRAIRGGLIRRVERWKTVWKGHCALYLEFLIFPASRPLCKRGKKKRKSTTPAWLQTFWIAIFSPTHYWNKMVISWGQGVSRQKMIKGTNDRIERGVSSSLFYQQRGWCGG